MSLVYFALPCPPLIDGLNEAESQTKWVEVLTASGAWRAIFPPTPGSKRRDL